jgi:3-hydroxypropanoate dehydrogenase
MKMGPTASNCQPARSSFVKSKEAKERLKPHLSEGNREKTMAAPVCAIVGFDLKVLRASAQGHATAGWLCRQGRPDTDHHLAQRLAAGRLLHHGGAGAGLDAGPMSGFDNAGVDQEFFAGTDIRSNFLCNIGYGDASGMRPRGPRFAFGEMAQVL